MSVLSGTPRDRVCIIGAGAAGLSAAAYLKEAGYAPTIYEASDHVGGKCHTFYEKGRAFELGGVLTTRAYRNTRELGRRVGMEHTLPPRRQMYDEEAGGLLEWSEGLRRGSSRRELFGALWRYSRVLARYREVVERPGYAAVPPELWRPVSEFLAEHRLEPLVRVLQGPVTAFGYGGLQTIPAIHVLKYINPENLRAIVLTSLGIQSVHRYVEGMQELWRRTAATLDVRLETPVERIERGQTIRVHAHGESAAYDRLILACPPWAALRMLDADETESRVLARARHYHYSVLLFRASPVPEGLIYRFPLRSPGRPWLVTRPWPDSDLCVAYFDTQYEAPDEAALTQALREDLPLFGGELTEVVRFQPWAYFPHFSAEDARAGAYDELEASQGHRRTFYSGGLNAFELVEPVVTYSRHLVETRFV